MDHDDTEPNDIQQAPFRKFNISPAPISRPPSSCGKRVIKIQKTNTRKRYKWNDRFHLKEEEKKQESLPPPPPLPRKKQSNKYSNIHSRSNNKKRSKLSSSSMLPPVDIVSGKRQWGLKGRGSTKRAKWNMINQQQSNRNINNHSIGNRQQRTKWNKNKPLQTVKKLDPNPLSLSRSRVFKMAPKIDHIQDHKKTKNIKIEHTKNEQHKNESDHDLSINLNKQQKKLFSEMLQTILQNKDKPNPQKYEINTLKKCNERSIIEQKEENEELYDHKNEKESDDERIANQTKYKEQEQSKNKRATRKLLPITSRNKKSVNQQRKQYLKPLDNRYHPR